jgi:hypothetical protein
MLFSMHTANRENKTRTDGMESAMLTPDHTRNKRIAIETQSTIAVCLIKSADLLRYSSRKLVYRNNNNQHGNIQPRANS